MTIIKKLHIVIKGKYFIQIQDGTKKEEYRVVKPYWVNKLVNKNYTHIVFQAGYSPVSPKIEVEYLGYEIRNITHEFFGDEEITVFVIKLGNIIS